MDQLPEEVDGFQEYAYGGKSCAAAAKTAPSNSFGRSPIGRLAFPTAINSLRPAEEYPTVR